MSPEPRPPASYRLPLRTLRVGSNGPDVRSVQTFLTGRKLYTHVCDGKYGLFTSAAVTLYQRSVGLDMDGVVGPQTWGSMISNGLVAVVDTAAKPDYPEFPDFLHPINSTNEASQKRWGKIEYQSAGTPDDREAIIITNGFEERNIVTEICPIFDSRVRLHREVMPDYLRAMRAIKDAGLSKFLLTFDGGFCPRFQRGSLTALSRHAWGSAFDVNCDYNPLGHEPARRGQSGCVFDLVPILNQCNFFWGGHFRAPRKDGMHFEHTGEKI